MKPRTRQYLDRAIENGQLASELAGRADTTRVHLRWAIVMTFYSAVQLVNGFLEEHLAAPRSHTEREAAMELFRDLREIMPQ